ncbi:MULTISPECIES: HlyD family secretion protein [unclassified Aureimonas]|uniref:HlyD family secretion protein n=1 Tax=unclassified Aureimonas TaxID=2615206 RepID=UPI000ACAA251|nr:MULTISPECIES: HlyD family secretion protein [unclassified Aureimonas]
MDDNQRPDIEPNAAASPADAATDRIASATMPLATDAQPPGARAPAPLPDSSPSSAPPATQPASAVPVDPGPPKKLKAKPSTVLWMILVALVGAGIILYAWRLGPFASPIVTTENSYVRGQITVLAPQVNGYVTDVLVTDFQEVKAGDPLVKIDDRIYRQQLDQAEASLDQARANLSNADQTIAQNEAEIGARQADLFQAEAVLQVAQASSDRSIELGRQGLAPRSETDQTRSTLRTAEAGIARANAAINIAQQTRRSTEVSKRVLEAAIRSAEAQVDLAQINLDNTIVRAPRDGQVSEASVRPGQYVSAGSQLLFLVPRTLWVTANFKETQTHYLFTGQPAAFEVDALGGARFTGKVVEVSPATGSEFAVLRADNASGNFTKVVQRLPVRIAIDPGQPGIDRLRPGMSVLAHVDTSSAAPAASGWWSGLDWPDRVKGWFAGAS